MTTGVLALQGCIDPHREILDRLGEPNCKVIDEQSLRSVDRLIIPGGESSTMLRLLEKTGLTKALQEFGKTKPIWGICAGAILMAKEVTHPVQKSLQLMDIKAERNSYGSQIDSFKSTVAIAKMGKEMAADFIRAPRLSPLSKKVEILATQNNDAVLLQQGKHLASSFHVELGEDTGLHEYFLGL